MIEFLNWWAASPAKAVIGLLILSGAATWSIQMVKALKGHDVSED